MEPRRMSGGACGKPRLQTSRGHVGAVLDCHAVEHNKHIPDRRRAGVPPGCVELRRWEAILLENVAFSWRVDNID